jgi:hypothetical protein
MHVYIRPAHIYTPRTFALSWSAAHAVWGFARCSQDAHKVFARCSQDARKQHLCICIQYLRARTHTACAHAHLVCVCAWARMQRMRGGVCKCVVALSIVTVCVSIDVWIALRIGILLCRCVVVSLCRCVVVSLCRCGIVDARLYVCACICLLAFKRSGVRGPTNGECGRALRWCVGYARRCASAYSMRAVVCCCSAIRTGAPMRPLVVDGPMRWGYTRACIRARVQYTCARTYASMGTMLHAYDTALCDCSMLRFINISSLLRRCHKGRTRAQQLNKFSFMKLRWL